MSSTLMGFVHRQRRGAELFLLVLALVVGIGAYAAVGLGVEGTVPADITGYGGWLVALILGAHVVVRFTAPYADPVLLPLVAALNGLGLAVIHRLDLAYKAMGRKDDYAQQQLIWMTLGVVLFAGTLLFLRDHRTLQRLTYTTGLAALILLLLPITPGIGGANINGAQVWIFIGGFSFQPGEVAKVLLVVSFAGYLVQHRDALALAGSRIGGIDLPRGRDFGPILGMWALSLVVLVFENDLGSSLLFFGLFLIMIYVATERAGWLVVGGLMFAVGGLAAYLFVTHVKVRFEVWLHPMQYYNGTRTSSYQLVESMFGMGWGGVIGRGFGAGRPERIPYANSDFILGAVGEELGLTGVIAIILIYGLIVERALRTALIARDGFGKLLAVGLGGVFAMQVFVVVGGVTRLIPLTGLTTPFLSYGGSSLVANWVIVALLLRISDQARRPLPDLSALDNPDMESTQIVKVQS